MLHLSVKKEIIEIGMVLHSKGGGRRLQSLRLANLNREFESCAIGDPALKKKEK